MARPRLVKRMRKRLWGGLVTIRFYEDASMRVHCNHPSNDPAVEFAMVGATYKVLRGVYAGVGLPEPVMGSMKWNDDP